MVLISKITKESNQFYLLWLSSGVTLRISEDVLVKEGLSKGQELTDERIQKIKKTNSFDAGLQLALVYLNYQARTEKELRVHLKKKELLPQDIEKIMQKLREMQVVDDRLFSEGYVRSQARIGEKGPKILEQQLKSKGVSDEHIQKGLAEYTIEKQIEVAERVAIKAMKRYDRKSFKEAMHLVRSSLRQKGFTSEVIDWALEELSFEKDEEQEEIAVRKEGERLWYNYRAITHTKRLFKVKQALFKKRFDEEAIQQYIAEKEVEDGE